MYFGKQKEMTGSFEVNTATRQVPVPVKTYTMPLFTDKVAELVADYVREELRKTGIDVPENAVVEVFIGVENDGFGETYSDLKAKVNIDT
jgi:hypothetical protein